MLRNGTWARRWALAPGRCVPAAWTLEPAICYYCTVARPRTVVVSAVVKALSAIHGASDSDTRLRLTIYITSHTRVLATGTAGAVYTL